MFLLLFLFSSWTNLKINNDATTNVQNEEQVVVNPTDSTNIVAVWRDFRLGYRRVGIGTSIDCGRTWSNQLLSGTHYTRDSDPAITVSDNGIFHLVVLSYESTAQSNGLFLFNSTDKGFTWNGPYTVIDSVAGVFEDKQMVACDRTNSTFNGNIYVPWWRMGTVNNWPIMMARSTDGGLNFENPIQISDNASGYRQWPVSAIGPDGIVYISWIDVDANTIYIDRSTNGGVTFGSDIIVKNVNYSYGQLNGGITVFSFPAIDVDISGTTFHGNIYCAYMDDSQGHSDQDIFITKSTDNGLSWSSRLRVNDDAINNGCDQFHPWLKVDQNGYIYIIWLDRRNDQNNYLYDCYLSYSTDGGNSFLTNQRLSSISSNPNAGQEAGLLGEYIGLDVYNGDIHPVWTDTREGNQDVYTAYETSSHIEENTMNFPALITMNFIEFEYPLDIKILDISGRVITQYYQIKKVNLTNLTTGFYSIVSSSFETKKIVIIK